MAIKLLVVDDSSFFQRRISEILKPINDIEIVGFANNGKEAIDKVQSLSPDVITLDYEMPVMDGLTALRNIMKVKPTPVLMFSSLTYDGARITLDALDAGAIDFLPKNFEDLQRGGGKIRAILQEKIKAVAREYNRSAGTAALQAAPVATPQAPAEKPSPKIENKIAPNVSPPLAKKVKQPTATQTPKAVESQPAPTTGATFKNNTRLKNIDLVLIGTSTGGPVALQNVLTGLPANFSKPILLIQHMPASFTGAFAERLDGLCRIQVKLAQDGDQLKPGVALLAPGGKQMLVERNKIRIIDSDDRLNYKPCVDLTFASAAKHYPGKSLGIVLTGMGSDGRDGAKIMKETGCPIWAQDKATCVIYGMPMSIAKAGLADAILPLQEFAPTLINAI